MHIEFDNLVYPYDFACLVIPLNYKLEDRLFQTSYVECSHKFHTPRPPVFPWKLSSRSIKLYIRFGPSEAYSLIFITQYIHFGPSKAYSSFMIEKNMLLQLGRIILVLGREYVIVDCLFSVLLSTPAMASKAFEISSAYLSLVRYLNQPWYSYILRTLELLGCVTFVGFVATFSPSSTSTLHSTARITTWYLKVPFRDNCFCYFIQEPCSCTM